jgi:hypothetical protein
LITTRTFIFKPATCIHHLLNRNLLHHLKSSIVDGNALHAASVLVAQAAFNHRTPLRLSFLSQTCCFSYLAKLVMSSGLLQQFILSQLLTILYPYADKCRRIVAPIHLPSLDSVLVSLMCRTRTPCIYSSIPPGDSSGWTWVYSLQKYSENALMMKRFEPAGKTPNGSLLFPAKVQAFRNTKQWIR